MKKVVITIGIAALIAGSCGQLTKKQVEIDDTEVVFFYENEEDIEFQNEGYLSDNEDFGNRKNPLYGKIYKNTINITEDIPELKHENDRWWINIGKTIDVGKDAGNNRMLDIKCFEDSRKNMICIFNEYKYDERGIARYKILDTIRIEKLKDREYFAIDCKQDGTMLDNEIIAIVRLEDGEDFYADGENYFNKVIRAWRADTKTGRIKPIENLKGIVGISRNFYVD